MTLLLKNFAAELVRLGPQSEEPRDLFLKSTKNWHFSRGSGDIKGRPHGTSEGCVFIEQQRKADKSKRKHDAWRKTCERLQIGNRRELNFLPSGRLLSLVEKVRPLTDSQ